VPSATSVASFLNWVVNPEDAANQLATLLASSNIIGALREIGVALLYLFALIEVYRLWFRGTGTDFAVLAAKVAIINVLITGPVLNNAALSLYMWTTRAAYSIAGQASASTATDLSNAFNVILAVPHPGGGPWGLVAAVSYIATNLASVFMMVGIYLLYLVVLALVLAIYSFALLGSAVIYSLAIALVPLLFPMFIWPATANFGGRWVSTVLHAIFMPLIGAVMLYAALSLGLVAPVAQWAQCVANASNASGAAVSCFGAGAGAFLKAIMGGMVAVLLMFSVDGVVSNFFPAVEVTTAGLIGAKFALGGARKAAGAAAGAAGGAMGRAIGGGGTGVGAGAPSRGAGWGAGESPVDVGTAPAGLPAGDAAPPGELALAGAGRGAPASRRDASLVSPGEVEWAAGDAGLQLRWLQD
jgi:type IV secretory pathway VirB6-like protein